VIHSKDLCCLFIYIYFFCRHTYVYFKAIFCFPSHNLVVTCDVYFFFVTDGAFAMLSNQ
jgi:hypothetical protein